MSDYCTSLKNQIFILSIVGKLPEPLSPIFFNLQIENATQRENAKNVTKPDTPRLKWLKSHLAMSVCPIH